MIHQYRFLLIQTQLRKAPSPRQLVIGYQSSKVCDSRPILLPCRRTYIPTSEQVFPFLLRHGETRYLVFVIGIEGGDVE